MTRARATAIGSVAILLWSLLALLTVGTAPVPPMLLNALTFGLGALVGLIWVTLAGDWPRLRTLRWPELLFGTAGLFGYHALYFSALRLAPPAQASLIAYLWPLFIVLVSGLLPGERLRPAHVLGAMLAFAGAALIVLRGGVPGGDPALAGLALAFLCAVTWALYSVGSRRLQAVPTGAVALYCLATALLSALAHLIWEVPAWPVGAAGWGAVLALGIGPVGLAFYVWDIGMKRGDIQFLGVASYGAPLLSTLALVLAGVTPATPVLGIAALLVTGGAALAARAGQGRR